MVFISMRANMGKEGVIVKASEAVDVRRFSSCVLHIIRFFLAYIASLLILVPTLTFVFNGFGLKHDSMRSNPGSLYFTKERGEMCSAITAMIKKSLIYGRFIIYPPPPPQYPHLSSPFHTLGTTNTTIKCANLIDPNSRLTEFQLGHLARACTLP